MSHTLINCTCKNRLGFSLLSFTLIPQYFNWLKLVQLIKNTLKQTKFEDKTVKFTQPSLVLIGLHDFLIFSNRTAHAWSVEVGNRLRETDFPSQSFSPKSAVKYLHVGRRKIQISPPLGEQDQSNALPQGQQRQSNPHPIPCLPHPPPRRLYIDRCINPLF